MSALVPQNNIDASVTQNFPKNAKAVASLATDVDLTAYFPQGYARRIRVGGTGNVAVLHAGAAAPVTYIAPYASGFPVLEGCFITLKSTGNGTTVAAANLIVEE